MISEKGQKGWNSWAWVSMKKGMNGKDSEHRVMPRAERWTGWQRSETVGFLLRAALSSLILPPEIAVEAPPAETAIKSFKSPFSVFSLLFSLSCILLSFLFLSVFFKKYGKSVAAGTKGVCVCGCVCFRVVRESVFLIFCFVR